MSRALFRPMRRTTLRAPITVAAIALSFTLGWATQRVREVHAQSQPSTVSNVYVPAGGLTFRALDGRPLARITQDDSGGVVEIFGAAGGVAQRMTSRAIAPRSGDRASNASSFVSDDPFEATAPDRSRELPRELPRDTMSSRPSPGF